MGRVVAAGHVNWDVSLDVDRLPVADDEALVRDQHRAGGGSAANVAAGLAGLDVPASVVGAVGDDEPGRLVRAELRTSGVDCGGLLVRDGPTTLKYLLVDDDGQVAILGNEGVNESYAAADVDADGLRRADHLHLTNQPPETAAQLAALAREAGTSVSFDPGRRAGDRDFGRILAVADLVFLAEREAEVLDADPAAVAGPDTLVAVTCGPGGARLYGGTVAVDTVGGRTPTDVASDTTDPDGDRVLEHPGFEATPLDTSGAGDAFAAGFLSVWLDEDSLHRALEIANACGALASERRGARAAPDREVLEEFLPDRT